jgi:putative SOS response-associated peptidase YedK
MGKGPFLEFIIVGAIVFGIIGFFIDGGKGALWGANRMPVIVDPDGALTWLDGCEIGTVPRLPVGSLTWHAVSRDVGAVGNKGPEMIEPVE